MSCPGHFYSILVFPTYIIMYSISIGSILKYLKALFWQDPSKIHTLQFPLKIYEIDPFLKKNPHTKSKTTVTFICSRIFILVFYKSVAGSSLCTSPVNSLTPGQTPSLPICISKYVNSPLSCLVFWYLWNKL